MKRNDLVRLVAVLLSVVVSTVSGMSRQSHDVFQIKDGWEGESTAEQWPYRVKFYQTNVYGKANNDTYPTAIHDMAADSRPDHNNVYTVTGQIVRRGSTSLDGLPNGIYVVGGKKVIKK